MKAVLPIALFLLTLVSSGVSGQVKTSGQAGISGQATIPGPIMVNGTVYDRSRYFAMPGVSVMGTSGQGTMTDSTGQYHIRVSQKDSIYFSYLGKATVKFPVKSIATNYPMDISLAVRVDSLPLVVVRPKAYRYDSLENREEYRKVFDYDPQGVVGPSSSGMGVGVDLDMLFGARRKRQMLSLQRRLVEEEQDKYVDYRFNRVLVRKITGLQGAPLDVFMRQYRPTYDFIKNCENDYEYYKYIKDCGVYFTQIWRQDNP